MSKRVNKKLKKELLGLIVLLAVIAAGYFYYGNFDFLNTDKEKIELINSEAVDVAELNNNQLNIIFFYVGQADCTLVKLNDKVMLIDAGNNNDGENISNYLKLLGITKINYLVGTHADEDHIGGLDEIVKDFEIEKLFMSEVGKDSENYKNVIEQANRKNLTIEYPKRGDIFELDGATCEIMMALKGEDVSDNDSSLVIELKYNKTTYLFMGDGEREVEEARNWNKVNVLKVGHHGSNTSSSNNFLNQILPDLAIIEVGKDNPYNLPSAKAISRLESIGAKIYRTDTNTSSFWLTSDGEKIEIKELKVNLDGN